MALLPTLPVPAAAQLEAPDLLRLWHLSSLDAPTVAVVWTLAFARALHTRIPAWLVLVVGLSAWAFYIGDRLLDARDACSPLRPRHHFHWRHRRLFVPLGVGAAALALALVVDKMPLRTEARDSLLAAAALLYFTGVHGGWQRRIFPKELLVGLVFTAACATPALSRTMHPATLLPALFLFAALAWLNCAAIESWEAESEGARSARPVLRRAMALAACSLFAAGIAAALREPRISLLLAEAAGSAAMLGVLDRGRHRISPLALRAAADLVLLTPLALLVLPR